MSYRVILEGAGASAPVTEETLAELERHLLTARVSPKLIKPILAGKPQVVKTGLNYGQAVKLCDRLMEFGLDSVIDPPEKLEEENIPTVHAKAAGASVAAGGGTAAGVAVPRQAAHPGSKPDLTLIKAGRKKGAFSTTQKSIPKTARSTNTNKTGKRSAAGPARTATSSPPADVQAAAADIKSLFRLPPKGLGKVAVTQSVRTRLVWQSLVSLIMPMIYVAVIGLLVLGGFFLSSALFSVLGAGYWLVWALGSLLLWIPLGTLCLSLAMPLMGKPDWDDNRIDLTAASEPRLFMFISALTKILGAPVPVNIGIDGSARFTAHQDCSPKAFLGFKQPLDGPVELVLGQSALEPLSTRQFAEQFVMHYCHFGEASPRRPQAVMQWVVDWATRGLNRSEALSGNLKQLESRLSESSLSGVAVPVIERLRKSQQLAANYFSRCIDKTRTRLEQNNPLAPLYLNKLFPDADIKAIRTQQTLLTSAWKQAGEKATGSDGNIGLVDNLGKLTHYFYQKEGGKDLKKPGTGNGVITRDIPVKKLVQNYQDHARDLALAFYRKAGFRPKPQSLVSVDALLQRDNRSVKAARVAEGYYEGWTHSFQNWKLPAPESLVKMSQSELVGRLNKTIDSLRRQLPDRTRLLANHYQNLKQIAELRATKKIKAAGGTYLPNKIGKGENIDHALQTREARAKENINELMHQNAIMGERLGIALILDREHKNITQKLYKTLSVLSDCTQKINAIAVDREELKTLVNNSPKKMEQAYQLHIKKLQEKISRNIKMVSAKMKHCPHDFFDSQFPTVYALYASQVTAAGQPANPVRKTLTNADVLLESFAQGYKTANDLAANYASQTEKKYKISPIRKI